jgi:chromosome segregation ATPase
LEQKDFRAKSLELIHSTKEFLQLKKTYEDSVGALISIKNARMQGRNKLGDLPKKSQEFVRNAPNLDEAEKQITANMSELKSKMAALTPEIKKLSEELQPYTSEIKQTKRTPTTKLRA